MRNPLNRSCPLEVLAGLEALRAEADSVRAARYVGDMILYAVVGRDRRKLTMEFVEQTRAGMRLA